MKNELQRQRSGTFGRARRSEKEISQAEVKRIKELAQGIPKQDLYQPGIATTDRSLQLLRAHPLPEPQRTCLASSSMALIVFLPSLEEQAASMAVTHFHILPTEREHELKWVKLELLPAFHPAVVIPFENGSVKDRALAQLQYPYRFNFLEEKGVQLNACTLREDVAQEPTFKLGSVPLKNLALLDESLRAFFWYKGYISNRDLITEQVRGLNKSKVVVRNNRCYAWVQKCTVVKAGNKDQEIPAEPVEMCTICGPSQSRPLPVVDSAVPYSPEIPRQIPRFPDHLRSDPKSAPMSRDKTKTCSVASPPAIFSSLLSKNDTKVPGHAPEKQCPATVSGIQPIMPAFYVTNDGRGHISSPKNHRQVRSQNAFETPTRSGTAVTDARAPNRKVMS